MAEALNKPLDLSAWVYQVIRGKILDGTYPPGSQLKIELISAELRVSRTPIREALLRLKNDRFVRSEPRVGFFVQEITRKDLHEVVEVRMLVESYAAECAALAISEEDAEKLKEIQFMSVEQVSRGEYGSFKQTTQEIHNLLLGYVKNRIILEMLNNATAMISRVQETGNQDPENIKCSLAEHSKIISAVILHDPKTAREAMREHLNSMESRIAERFPDKS